MLQSFIYNSLMKQAAVTSSDMPAFKNAIGKRQSTFRQLEANTTKNTDSMTLNTKHKAEGVPNGNPHHYLASNGKVNTTHDIKPPTTISINLNNSVGQRVD